MAHKYFEVEKMKAFTTDVKNLAALANI